MTTEIRNWIADNRNAEQPPAYFLQRLYDFDAMLVLMPSRDVPGAYVLGRRKQFGKGLTEEGLAGVYSKPDTRMAILNNAVPVCMVFRPIGTAGWNPDSLIQKLKARDIWEHGGAEKVADMLEAQEDAEKEATRAAIRDDMWNRSGAQWRSYQARTGASSNRFHERFKSKTQGDSPAPVPETPAQVSESTVGLGRDE